MPVLEPKPICDDFYVKIEPDMQYVHMAHFPAEEEREILKEKAEEILKEAKRHVNGYATLGFTVWWECPICHGFFDTKDNAKWDCQEEDETCEQKPITAI